MRPLSCTEARQEVARRLFEAIEAHTEATLTAHLAACMECRLHADEVDQASRLLSASLLRDEPPAGLEWRVVEAVRSAPVARPGTRRRLLAWTLAFALAGLGILLIALPTSSDDGSVATLSPTDRFARAGGSARVFGTQLELEVMRLPALATGSAYGVWVGDAGGGWQLVGEFRSTETDALYRVRGTPEVVRVTIERAGSDPETPGLEVLTGRF